MALLLGAVGQRDDGVAVVLARRHRLLVRYVAVLVVPLKEGGRAISAHVWKLEVASTFSGKEWVGY